ncbi:helix-turn-helix domain-containing protein [Streptomyces sp. NPDC057249]|uniref:helix-turn-helix domain-containing protein n=1 Tax=Streptomyces sp. NPDC057249 TaxID=3346067 RepID=UPI00363EDDBC
MIGAVFRTDDVPAAERFEYWRGILERTRPSTMSSPHAEHFRAELLLMELGAVKVWPASFLPTRYRLDAQQARQVDAEYYHLTLLLEGELGLERAGKLSSFGSRDLFMIDDSEPYDLQSVGNGPDEPVTGVGIDIPKTLLPWPEHRVRPLLGRRFSGREGMGVVLTDFLSGLTHQTKVLAPNDASPLGAVVVELVSAWLAQASRVGASLSPETRHTALLRQIEAFIGQNLHHPDLTPRMVAAAHHISVSHLHRIYELRKHGETVAAQIRRKRLEGARRDLESECARTTPIYKIGEKWGFFRASEFSRAFKVTYGISPREHRAAKLDERS